MIVKYVGKSFGVDGLSNGQDYEVVEIDLLSGALRIIDDSGEDYLYDPVNPRPFGSNHSGGKFEIVQDDQHGSLKKLLGKM